jgi:hypothetical protein
MSAPSIPPLPETALAFQTYGDVFTADQMRTFYAAGVEAGANAERERCALICEDLLCYIRPVGPNHAERPYKNGLADGHRACAAAIRKGD